MKLRILGLGLLVALSSSQIFADDYWNEIPAPFNMNMNMNEYTVVSLGVNAALGFVAGIASKAPLFSGSMGILGICNTAYLISEINRKLPPFGASLVNMNSSLNMNAFPQMAMGGASFAVGFAVGYVTQAAGTKIINGGKAVFSKLRGK